MKKALLRVGMPFILAIFMLMGAPVSWGATFTVNSTADAVDANLGDGVCATATSVCTLRAAVQEANAAPAVADTIILPAGIYTLTLLGANEDLAATGDLDLIGTVIITGAGEKTTIIDGNATDRIFQTLTNGTVATISGVTIRNGNSGALPGGGFSVSAGTSLTLNNAVVTNCVTGAAAEGGGVDNSGALTMNDVAITSNTSPGGGVNNGATGTLTLTKGTLSGNSDRAINNSGTLTLTNVTISGNTTTGNGAGLDNGGTATLLNVTINGNTSSVITNIGGIRNAATVNISNSIISNNTPSNCGGVALTSTGNNISGDATCNLAGIGDVNSTDPLLGPLAPNFSRFQTHALLTGSPAIDTGNALTCPATDERGILRPQAAVCDKGAFEFCAPGFGDVPAGAFGEGFINSLFCRRLTAGCTEAPLAFCPNNAVTRGQMAVFVESVLGVATVPTCVGNVFTDVTAASVGAQFCGFIEDFAARGITGGCAPGLFCPNDPVTRAQMAVFMEVALGATPAATCAGTFADANATVLGVPFCGFIEDFALRGITGGCGAGLFCPNDAVTRAQMAVFLTAGFLQ